MRKRSLNVMSSLRPSCSNGELNGIEDFGPGPEEWNGEEDFEAFPNILPSIMVKNSRATETSRRRRSITRSLKLVV